MTTTPRVPVLCPRCNDTMNHHADKIDPRNEEAIEASSDEMVPREVPILFIYGCPSCGTSLARPAITTPSVLEDA